MLRLLQQIVAQDRPLSPSPSGEGPGGRFREPGICGEAHPNPSPEGEGLKDGYPASVTDI